MSKRVLFAVPLVLLALLASAQTRPERSLQVKLNYTGAGKVDDAHKIFVFVFDTPDFMQGSGMPIASQAATAKDQTISFSDLSPSTVYIVCAFDPKGEYDGMSGPPPSGASVGLYSKEPGKPAPIAIEAGKPAKVDLPFDDTTKMP